MDSVLTARVWARLAGGPADLVEACADLRRLAYAADLGSGYDRAAQDLARDLVTGLWRHWGDRCSDQTVAEFALAQLGSPGSDRSLVLMTCRWHGPGAPLAATLDVAVRAPGQARPWWQGQDTRLWLLPGWAAYRLGWAGGAQVLGASIASPRTYLVPDPAVAETAVRLWTPEEEGSAYEHLEEAIRAAAALCGVPHGKPRARRPASRQLS